MTGLLLTLLQYTAVRLFLVVLVTVELITVPFAWAFSWWFLLLTPAVLVGIMLLGWAFTKAVEWAEEGIQ